MSNTPLFTYTMRLADDSAILCQRLSEWCGHASHLEEDIALTNVALDLIGHARALYSYAGEQEGKGRDEDAMCFYRVEREYTNLLLVEQPNDDFAYAILRQFLFSAFMHPFWEAMIASKDEQLSALAAKAEKEVAYHLRHSAEWVIRLGDGTEESHNRACDALETLWMYTGELFECDTVVSSLVAQGVAIDPLSIKHIWDETVNTVLARANLERPDQSWMQTGGRKGEHSEHLGHILAPMQYLQRSFPNAIW
ncbi:1,2-phenylacetyl-CoA epoxidase subunit PaaC [Pseudovibrio sp. Tun.PSC04-5.I4]|uniref:1,2-phenylacetyl-CoA epoxidase subunit PaaC n=1 Tax=Pseudovibrio sp. Tun.PSC04-5.I4 TaxID=1798213 RepID=UPI00088B6E3F|nr:1,2-phenylacetyl-CoA epoxidase subunit PaaC [Pseudovibrio sp. Tun.PSC04-5.I4]SDQ85436.1 ring-1,2-phenylacetyl-CoA epoxidase subunit PaaC [Pseudovibrio sp. Tun.PSC04-5.I4]